jgi:hypothetical protein
MIMKRLSDLNIGDWFTFIGKKAPYQFVSVDKETQLCVCISYMGTVKQVEPDVEIETYVLA